MKNLLLLTILFFTLLITTAEAENEKSLRIIMTELEADMEAVVRGINYGDFNAIKVHAIKIADHDKPPASQMQKVMTLLGAEMPDFKKGDAFVHDTAVNVAKAAEEKDYAKVVEGYTALLGGCVACHTTYRSKIVEHFKER